MMALWFVHTVSLKAGLLQSSSLTYLTPRTVFCSESVFGISQILRRSNWWWSTNTNNFISIEYLWIDSSSVFGCQCIVQHCCIDIIWILLLPRGVKHSEKNSRLVLDGATGKRLWSSNVVEKIEITINGQSEIDPREVSSEAVVAVSVPLDSL